MEKKNILLSFPRSGNHLCRFFIELLSETPTFGCKGSHKDKEIYTNIFDEHIPFNINKNIDKNKAYYKYHNTPENIIPQSIILIVRNPQEVLIRHCGENFDINTYNNYFKLIDFYKKFNGKKLLLFYEDMIINRKEFINKLYIFLGLKNLQKKNYVLSNLNKLYTISSNAKYKAWGGFNSKYELNFYYKNISNEIKKGFDEYLENKLKQEEYRFLKIKYNI